MTPAAVTPAPTSATIVAASPRLAAPTESSCLAGHGASRAASSCAFATSPSTPPTPIVTTPAPPAIKPSSRCVRPERTPSAGGSLAATSIAVDGAADVAAGTAAVTGLCGGGPATSPLSSVSPFLAPPYPGG